MTEQPKYMESDMGASEGVERKRAEGVWWAVALIWAGLVFGAESMDLLPQIGEASAWTWVFLGAGAFGLLSNLYYASRAGGPKPRTWDWLWSGALAILGLFGFTTLDLAWPLILILAGGAILAGNYLGR